MIKKQKPNDGFGTVLDDLALEKAGATTIERPTFNFATPNIIIEEPVEIQAPRREEPTSNTDEFLRVLSTINRQVAQGATMDFADEIGGAIAQQLGPSGRQGLERIQRFVSGEEVSPEEALQRQMAAASLGYRDVQQVGQAQSERDREERPWISLASNIAGGLLTGRALGGAATGAANRAGQTVSNNFPVFTQPLRTAASAVRGSRLGRAATNVVGGSAVGAGYGAVAGVGASQGNLDTEEGRERMVEDAQRGAGYGAAFGGGLSILGEGLTAAIRPTRRELSGTTGLQEILDPAQMDQIMIPTEAQSLGERMAGVNNPRTAQEILSGMQAAQNVNLQNTEALSKIHRSVMPAVINTVRNALDNLPSGIQPRLARVLRNIEVEARRGTDIPVVRMNAMLDELAELAQGSRAAQQAFNELSEQLIAGVKESTRLSRLQSSGVHPAISNVTPNSVELSGIGARLQDVLNRENIGGTIGRGTAAGAPPSRHTPFVPNGSAALYGLPADLVQSREASMKFQQAVDQMRKNIEQNGGRISPVGLEQLASRYAGWVVTGLPVNLRARWIKQIMSALVNGVQEATPAANLTVGQQIGQEVNEEPVPRFNKERKKGPDSDPFLTHEEQRRQLQNEGDGDRILTPEEQIRLLRLETEKRSLRSQRRRNKRTQ